MLSPVISANVRRTARRSTPSKSRLTGCPVNCLGASPLAACSAGVAPWCRRLDVGAARLRARGLLRGDRREVGRGACERLAGPRRLGGRRGRRRRDGRRRGGARGSGRRGRGRGVARSRSGPPRAAATARRRPTGVVGRCRRRVVRRGRRGRRPRPGSQLTGRRRRVLAEFDDEFPLPLAVGRGRASRRVRSRTTRVTRVRCCSAPRAPGTGPLRRLAGRPGPWATRQAGRSRDAAAGHGPPRRDLGASAPFPRSRTRARPSTFSLTTDTSSVATGGAGDGGRGGGWRRRWPRRCRAPAASVGGGHVGELDGDLVAGALHAGPRRLGQPDEDSRDSGPVSRCRLLQANAGNRPRPRPGEPVDRRRRRHVPQIDDHGERVGLRRRVRRGCRRFEDDRDAAGMTGACAPRAIAPTTMSRGAQQ